MTLVALIAVTTGAWADETPLVTINASSDFKSGSKTFDNKVTATFSQGVAFSDGKGWFAYSAGNKTLTVEPVDGVTITRVKFYTTLGNEEVTAAPFEASMSQTYVYVSGGSGSTTSQLRYHVSVNGIMIGDEKSFNYLQKIEVYGTAEPPIEVAWDATTKTGTFTMPGGNVTLEPEYYPQATVADGGVTAADADARATTDDPLVKVDATKLTGAKKLMYFVSNSGTAPAYDAEGWTDQLPTAKGLTQQGIVYVWYYPVGIDEGVDGATATYSDGDICLQSITARIAAEPTYAVTFAEGTDPNEWTASPAADVKKGETVTVTYTGTKKIIGVKAEKKSDNPYANAKLGDLFYSDGTFGTTLEAGKTPIGVIAYLDQEGTDDDEITEKSNGAGHGLVLCLKDAASGADAKWSTEKSAFEFGEDAKVASVDALKRTTNVSGYTNTKTLAEKTDAATKYKAAYAAKNYAGLTAPTGTTGWFLPSAQQWVKMQTGLGALEESVFTWNSWFDNSHTAADKWEAALSKAGSGNYDSMTSAYLFCWSSSEYSVSSAVGLYVGAQNTGFNYGFRWLFRTKDDESDGNRVRPVLAF